ATTIHMTDNAGLYDEWARTYDSDGNVLQMLDSEAFEVVVIPLLRATDRPLRVLELGCGTGRNTVRVRGCVPGGSVVYAVDGSAGMVEAARRKIGDLEGAEVEAEGEAKVKVEWALIDLSTQQRELCALLAASAGGQVGEGRGEEGWKVDAVVSTLVLEHVELDTFFGLIGMVLKPGGWAWVTDMHPEMGASRAGFRREADGAKVLGSSVNHSIGDTLASSRLCGLELVGEVHEKGVGGQLDQAVERYGPRARKWVGKNIFSAFLFSKV
ncbi:S-adenosyl-L-methionine-dependent methyltransferase, partial [Coprinopsis marcescibilis]